VGIGKPPAGSDVSAYVLNHFSAEEKKELYHVLEDAGDAVETVITEGPSQAMNSLN
jgi:PTH1 family peptidyl-tRNA hydrolase